MSELKDRSGPVHGENVASFRTRASEASGGTSGEHIYRPIQMAIQEFNLGGDVLDFGSGKGLLAARLLSLRCFHSVACVDLFPRPEDFPNEVSWYTQDLNIALELPDRTFDAIVSAEVIEHLENPRSVAREWFRLLKPGGWLLFSTPNNESVRSLLALVGRGHYQAFGDGSYPAHITALLRKDIERICAEAGFEVVRFRYTDHGVLPKSRRLSWQDISGGILRGVRFSDNVLAVCRRPALPES